MHTYGERLIDVKSGRLNQVPRLVQRPKVQVPIPDTLDGMPDSIEYNYGTLTLEVGAGRIAPVIPEVWEYDVGGMYVVKHWFGYRKRNPTGNRRSPLDEIVADRWSATMTTELLELLNVLGRCVALHRAQAELLERVLSNRCFTVEELTADMIIPAPAESTRRPHISDDPGLWEER